MEIGILAAEMTRHLQLPSSSASSIFIFPMAIR